MADEFNVQIDGGLPRDMSLGKNPNYDYVLSKLKDGPDNVSDEACLYDTLAIFAAIDTDRCLPSL